LSILGKHGFHRRPITGVIVHSDRASVEKGMKGGTVGFSRPFERELSPESSTPVISRVIHHIGNDSDVVTRSESALPRRGELVTECTLSKESNAASSADLATAVSPRRCPTAVK